MHLLAAIGGGGVTKGTPGHLPYRVYKKLLTPLHPSPGGKEVCSARLKGAIFQKSSIEGIVVSSEKYSRLPSFDVTILPEHVYQHTQSFCRRERHSFPAPSAKWRRHYKSLGSCYKSAKAFQSPHPRLKINDQSWQIPCHARECPRGYPPGWPLINQG